MQEEIKNQKSEQTLREEAVLSFWEENDIFEKSLTKKEFPKGEFVFYEGPPTANGKPGIHHLEARAFKDIIPRYKTMQGFHVRRKGGWDTHGLPVELQVEKELGLASKKEIENYGVAEFNQKCKESVWQYLDVWNKFTHRIGYWVDQKHPYITYHNSYIESLWNVVSEINKKGLLYKDYKVVPWCPRCGTALSSHELAQGYQDVKDLSVYVKFKVIDEENTYLLAWTTTPWTLPGNVALAVGSDIEYVKFEDDGIQYISSLEFYKKSQGNFDATKEPPKLIKSLKANDLIGLEYEPLYPYLSEIITGPEKEKMENAYKVYAADFVTTTDGTGIVHTAVMYGQDDFELGTKVGLPKFHLVDETGHFIKGTGTLEGLLVKDREDNGLKTSIEVLKYLQEKNLFFKKENYEHSYPHCWRCKTPLIYYARDSWYIAMSKLRDELVAENKKINWEPEYTKEGRFGEWLREIKDWAISRERYWGTPLPVWEKQNGEKVVIGSLDDLKKYTKKSGNNYFVMRHGGTEGNQANIVSFKNQETDNLTEEGKKGVALTGEMLKGKKIDLIIASPFTRTRETAEIIRKEIGLTEDQVLFDERLHEVNPGEFDGRNWDEYHEYVYGMKSDWFENKIPGGESYKDVQKRTAKFLYSIEEEYRNKNILIVTHGGPAWLLYVNAGLFTPTNEEYQKANTHAFIKTFKRFSNAEVRELPFAPLPHNKNFEIDLHKPYIDEVELFDEEGNQMKRTKEVMDVWFDSGAMPFAQDHYPFDNKDYINTEGFPADYISEAIDQTRGWFYTLHAVGVLMGKGHAYKNVICLGHLLDEKGKKMSKSLGNIVDPWEMIEKYGVDPLRFFMYSVNQPGESKNFDEKTVTEGVRKVFNILQNVHTFYELYRDATLENNEYPKTENILDLWILSRFEELLSESEKNLDRYKVLEPARAIRDFLDDLSTWYLRRSRERLKDGDVETKKTLYYVLKNLVKVMAPFTPFTAEDMYQKLKLENDPESVHLCEWPHLQGTGYKEEVINKMAKVREICTLGNSLRKQKNVPLRQPLRSVTLPKEVLNEEYFEIIKDELNVKEVLEKSDIEVIEYDWEISPELKKEGIAREIIRFVQDMRKMKGLKPDARIELVIETGNEGQDIITIFMADIQKTVGAEKISFEKNNGEVLKVDQLEFKVTFHDQSER